MLTGGCNPNPMPDSPLQVHASPARGAAEAAARLAADLRRLCVLTVVACILFYFIALDCPSLSHPNE